MLRWLSAGLIVVALAVALFLCIFTGILVNEDVAVKAVKDMGFKNIEVLDNSWFAVGLRGCGTEDAARFTVSAVLGTWKVIISALFHISSNVTS